MLRLTIVGWGLSPKKSVRQKISLSVPVGKTEVPELRSKAVFRRNLRARVHFFKDSVLQKK